MENRYCDWIEYPKNTYIQEAEYKTDCGVKYTYPMFVIETPLYRFCPCCGKEIKILRINTSPDCYYINY